MADAAAWSAPRNLVSVEHHVAAYTSPLAEALGSSLGEIQDETFSALEATITVTGVDAHPGYATGILVNAARVAARIVAALPQDRLTPETTSGREGFVRSSS